MNDKPPADSIEQFNIVPHADYMTAAECRWVADLKARFTELYARVAELERRPPPPQPGSPE
jgi:hypothetical protein